MISRLEVSFGRHFETDTTFMALYGVIWMLITKPGYIVASS